MKATPQKNGRRDRLIHERVHDPYQMKQKPPEPSVCPVCNAVFKDGRWQWAESWPLEAHQTTCQACRRTKDNYPAGVVTLTGAFVAAHKDELIRLACHQESEARNEHPLERILQLEKHRDRIVITTTDIHLPRRIGEALRSACKGKVEKYYDEEGYFVRVNWNREH